MNRRMKLGAFYFPGIDVPVAGSGGERPPKRVEYDSRSRKKKPQSASSNQDGTEPHSVEALYFIMSVIELSY